MAEFLFLLSFHRYWKNTAQNEAWYRFTLLIKFTNQPYGSYNKTKETTINLFSLLT